MVRVPPTSDEVTPHTTRERCGLFMLTNWKLSHNQLAMEMRKGLRREARLGEEAQMERRKTGSTTSKGGGGRSGLVS